MVRERAASVTTTAAKAPRLTAKLSEVMSFTSGRNLAKAVDGVTVDYLADLTKRDSKHADNGK